MLCQLLLSWKRAFHLHKNGSTGIKWSISHDASSSETGIKFIVKTRLDMKAQVLFGILTLFNSARRSLIMMMTFLVMMAYKGWVDYTKQQPETSVTGIVFVDWMVYQRQMILCQRTCCTQIRGRKSTTSKTDLVMFCNNFHWFADEIVPRHEWSLFFLRQGWPEVMFSQETAEEEEGIKGMFSSK